MTGTLVRSRGSRPLRAAGVRAWRALAFGAAMLASSTSWAGGGSPPPGGAGSGLAVDLPAWPLACCAIVVVLWASRVRRRA